MGCAAELQLLIVSAFIRGLNFFIITVVVMTASMAHAGTRIKVLADDTVFGRQLQQLLIKELQQYPQLDVLPVTEATTESADLLIILGSQLLRQQLKKTSSRSRILALLTRTAWSELPALNLRSGPQLQVLLLDQPLRRYLDLIRLAFPQYHRVGVLLATENSLSSRALATAFEERGLALQLARLDESDNLVTRLESLLLQSDVLLALPDGRVHNRNTVQPLLLTSYRYNVPVLAYSAAYAQAGALLALYSTPAQLAQQLAEMAANQTTAATVQSPRYFTVNVNRAVARSMGLSGLDPEDLRSRLMRNRADYEE